jgi:hypothetical protein
MSFYDEEMRGLVILFVHVITTLGRLFGQGGIRHLAAGCEERMTSDTKFFLIAFPGCSRGVGSLWYCTSGRLLDRLFEQVQSRRFAVTAIGEKALEAECPGAGDKVCANLDS